MFAGLQMYHYPGLPQHPGRPDAAGRQLLIPHLLQVLNELCMTLSLP